MAVTIKKTDMAAYEAKLKELGAEQGQSRVIKASGDIYVKDTKTGEYLYEGGRSTKKVKASYKKPKRPSTRRISVKSADVGDYLKEQGGTKDYYKNVKGKKLDSGRVVRTYKDARAYAKEELERNIYEEKLAKYKVDYDKYALAVGKEPKYGTIKTEPKVEEVIKTTVAPTPQVATVPPKSEPPKLQPTVIPIKTPEVIETKTEEKGFLGKIVGKVTDKVKDTELYKKVEDKVSTTLDNIQKSDSPAVQKIVEKVEQAKPKVEKVVDVITPPAVKAVDLASKIYDKVEEKVTSKKTADEKVAEMKADLYNAEVQKLDKTITGRDYEKEKALGLEKEKLSKIIAQQYPGMPGATPGLELLNPALELYDAGKEVAVDAYNKAVEEEQKRLDLQQKISGAPTPYEKAALQLQYEQLSDDFRGDVDKLSVEEADKGRWFGDSVERARDKVDLSRTYEQEMEERTKEINKIQLGASIVAGDLQKDIGKYEQEVSKLNVQTNTFNKKESEFKQLENKFETANTKYEQAGAEYEKLKNIYEANPNSQTEAAARTAFITLKTREADAQDVYEDYSQYGSQLQEEANKLTEQYNQLESQRKQLAGEQNKLDVAKLAYEDKAKQINFLTDTYSDSLKNISEQDVFERKKQKYQESLDYFKDVQAGGFLKSNAYDEDTQRYTTQVSQAGKVAGIVGATVGKFGIGVAEMARNIPEFVAVAPYREIKEDIAQGDFMPTETTGQKILTGVAPGAQIVQYWAKGVYDWDDPRNKDYSAKTNINWKAVEGAVDTALLGIAAAKPIASGAKATGKTLTKKAFKESFKAATKTGVGKWTKGLAKSVVGATVGTQAFKTGSYVVRLDKEEKDFVERGNEFQGAMQAGFAAEEKASSLALIPGAPKGLRGDVGALGYKIPGVPLLRTGIQKISTQKGGEYGKGESRTLDEFENAVRQYYLNKGYQPSEVETAVRAAMKQRQAGLTGEIAGTVSANVMSELLGQQFLKDAGGAVVAGKGTFWKPAFQIGKAGFVEGVAGELSTQIGRYEGVNVKDLAVTGTIGAVTAGLIGGTLAKTGSKLLKGGVYIADPYEGPGDVIAGVIERGAKKGVKKTVAKTAGKKVSTRVVSVVPSSTFTFTGTTTPAMAESLGIGTQTSIKKPKKSVPVAINVREMIYKPSTFSTTQSGRPKIPTPTETLSGIFTKGTTATQPFSFPTSTQVLKSTQTPTDISLLTGVKPSTWTFTPIGETPTTIKKDDGGDTFVDETVTNVNTITNIFSSPIVPTKTSTNINMAGSRGLNPAWLAAQQKKGSYGWVIENKIRDFAGDFLKKQSRRSVKRKLK